MWEKLNDEGYEVETLNMKAKHIKTWGDNIAERNGGFRSCLWKVVMRLLGGFKFKVIKYYELNKKKVNKSKRTRSKQKKIDSSISH